VSSAPPETKRTGKSKNSKKNTPEPRRATGVALDVALALSYEKGSKE
jgi:hypothetical protein